MDIHAESASTDHLSEHIYDLTFDEDISILPIQLALKSFRPEVFVWVAIASDRIIHSTGEIIPPVSFKERTIRKSDNDLVINFFDKSKLEFVPKSKIPDIFINEDWWHRVILGRTKTTMSWVQFMASGVNVFEISCGIILGLLPSKDMR